MLYRTKGTKEETPRTRCTKKEEAKWNLKSKKDVGGLQKRILPQLLKR